MSEINEVNGAIEDVDNGDGCFCWHHRTIRHIDSRFEGWGVASDDPEDDVYITAHEFSYTGTKTGAEYDGFTHCHSVAQSKQEAEWILQAYNFPPVVEVDEADHYEDEYGFPAYKKFVWLDKKVKRVAKKEVEEADNNVIHTNEVKQGVTK
jgi:hypothetical protein